MNLIWKIELSRLAQRQLKKLDKQSTLRIERFLYDKAAVHPRPQDLATPLKGRFLGLYKFRVGDYRIVCDSRLEQLVIVAGGIGHRKDIYD